MGENNQKSYMKFLVIALVFLIITTISAILGWISYVNDHDYVMRGFEAELIWFLISIPTFILAIINFIISYIILSKRVKTLENKS